MYILNCVDSYVVDISFHHKRFERLYLVIVIIHKVYPNLNVMTGTYLFL